MRAEVDDAKCEALSNGGKQKYRISPRTVRPRVKYPPRFSPADVRKTPCVSFVSDYPRTTRSRI